MLWNNRKTHGRGSAAGTRIRCLFLAPAVLAVGSFVQAGSITLEEPSGDGRVYAVATQMKILGTVKTAAGGGKTESHDLKGAAAFRYRERRLPPAGRDALAFRSLREFESARVENAVDEHKTVITLPKDNSLIVSGGEREGVCSYCPTAFLTRETLDLLELPGDTLALSALLPLKAVDEGEEWAPSDWAAQMLANVEAVEKSSLHCKLASVKDGQARIEFGGNVQGVRQGATTTSKFSGYLMFDTTQHYIRAAQVQYEVSMTIGTVSPGTDAKIGVALKRDLSQEQGQLNDTITAKIPLDAPADVKALLFEANPWNMRFRHGRDWHVFQAVMEGQPQVVILRLMEKGGLIAQCNLSPVPTAAPGQHVPLEQFEADIRKSLGQRFKEIKAREEVPGVAGKQIFRVVAEGNVELRNAKGSTGNFPMNWIYYLVVDKTGRQVSFVFSVESSLMEQLNERDLDIVRSVQFIGQDSFPVRSAEKR